MADDVCPPTRHLWCGVNRWQHRINRNVSNQPLESSSARVRHRVWHVTWGRIRFFQTRWDSWILVFMVVRLGRQTFAFRFAIVVIDHLRFAKTRSPEFRIAAYREHVPILPGVHNCTSKTSHTSSHRSRSYLFFRTKKLENKMSRRPTTDQPPLIHPPRIHPNC